MVDRLILLADGGKTIAAILAHPLGEAGVIGAEFQFRPVNRDNFGGLVEGEHTIDQKHLVRLDFQLLHHKIAKAFGRGRIDFKPEWFDIDSDETPEGETPDVSKYAS